MAWIKTLDYTGFQSNLIRDIVTRFKYLNNTNIVKLQLFSYKKINHPEQSQGYFIYIRHYIIIVFITKPFAINITCNKTV